MTRKASGHSALIFAAGLLFCLGGPARAVGSDGATAAQTEESAGKPIALNKFSKSRARGKSAAKPRKNRGVLARGYRPKPIDSRTAVSKVADVKTRDAGDTGPDDKVMAVAELDQPLPDKVANANAQWPAPNGGAATAGATPTVSPPAVTASDQLNTIDKTLSEAPATVAEPAPQMAQTMQTTPEQRAQASQEKLMSAMAQADPPSVSSGDSAWGQSSTIGKIFIAIGGLLTLASAVRMFMA